MQFMIIKVVCAGGNFQPLMLIEFFIPNLNRIYFCKPKIFKTNVYNQFLLHNYLLNLWSSAVNSQRLLCSQKAGMNCSN